MHIRQLAIKNFRGLENITLDAGEGLNVIAGPNAVGKTTILEAIRLSKVLLAQRFEGEAQQVLAAMGATQNGIVSLNAPFAMLAHDAGRPIEISMKLRLDADEIGQIKGSIEQLAIMMLQTELARSINENVTNLAQYLSTIDGQNRLSASREYTKAMVADLNETFDFTIDAKVDVNSGQIRGLDSNAQTMLTFLERTLTPNVTHFNYFTADRALPTGEVGIQLGAGDVQQQITSYLAQPAIKWQRVKQLIIQTMLFNEAGRTLLTDEFNLIFDELLPGKRLAGVSMNENSVLRVLIEDTSSKKQFDIDSMSSGEKGLVLTFLTLRLSSKNNTIVMLDEPELHLNAAVCARIVRFMKKHCVSSKGLQLFVCSHSPEIVRDAFEDEECKLFHLRSSVDLSPVYQQDSREVFEILNRLGTSTADVLFSRGAVFVEGEHDAAILQSGYGETLQGFKVQPLGGRSEVEKDIPRLQDEEKAGKLDRRQLFVFDKDRKVTDLKSTKLVRVYQLERYCVENYLLDETYLYDVVIANMTKDAPSRGEFAAKLEELAFAQLDDYVISEVYRGLEPENPGIRPKEVNDKGFIEAANILWNRLVAIKHSVGSLDEDTWKKDFLQRCDTKRGELEPSWKANWRKNASGKLLIDSLYRTYEIGRRKLEFKKSVIAKMAEAKTETWRVLNSVLDEQLNR